MVYLLWVLLATPVPQAAPPKTSVRSAPRGHVSKWLRIRRVSEKDRLRGDRLRLWGRARPIREGADGFREAIVRYADRNETMTVLTHQRANKAIRDAKADKFVKLLDGEDKNVLELRRCARKLWDELIGDNLEGSFDSTALRAAMSDGGMEIQMDIDENEYFDEEFSDRFPDFPEDFSEFSGNFPEKPSGEGWDDAGDVERAPGIFAGQSSTADNLESAAARVLEQAFPTECNPQFGGAVLQGARYAGYQIPDIMLRGAVPDQPKYAEFIHRDIDTCSLPREIDAAMENAGSYSYRFYNIWIAMTDRKGTLDQYNQVTTYPNVILLPRDGGAREWKFLPPSEHWNADRLLWSAEHVFVTAPFLAFDSADLWHGAARWRSQLDSVYPMRESVELRFRCRCYVKTGDKVSPVSAARNRGALGPMESRHSDAFYPEAADQDPDPDPDRARSV
ncbi:hypothetical protein AAMO2058_000993900 [Amorphochlora amoebiformis]